MFFSTKELTIFDAHELYLEGKYEKSLHLCEQILAMYPDRYSALNLIANIYFINGEFDKGEQYICKLKDYFLNKKEYSKAIAAIKRLISMHPEKVKYYHHIAEIYEMADDKKGYYRYALKAAEIHRRAGRFKEAADAYMGMASHFRKPEFLISLLNKMTVIGEADKVCELAFRYIFPSDQFTDEEKDDITLLCAESGCKGDYFIEMIPGFVARGKDRLGIVENAVVNYFTDNKNDDVFRMIASTGADTESLIARISDVSPENLPDDINYEQIEEPAVEEVTEQLPETLELVTDKVETDETQEFEHIEIDSHIMGSEEEVEISPIELDTYDNGGELHVDSSIADIEKFDCPSDDINVETLEGLESSLIEEAAHIEEYIDAKPEPVNELASDCMGAFDDVEAVYPEEDGLELFDSHDNPEASEDYFAGFGDSPEGESSDIFSAFDNPDANIGKVAEQINISDIKIEEPEKKDIFEDIEEVKKEEKHIEKLDMSDVVIEKSEEKDIFEDMEVEENKEEQIVEKLDMSDIKIEKNDEDMFAGLVEEKEEEVKKETEKLDMSDVKTEDKHDEDIFEREV